MEKKLQELRIDPRKKRPAMGSKWLLVLVSLFIGSLVTLTIFRTFWGVTGPPTGGTVASAADIGTDPVSPDTAETPARDPRAPILIVSGYIVPHHRIEVGSKIVGKVSWVGVEKSDKVEAGQLLVKLDDSEYRAQLKQAGAALANARARLTELEAGSRPEEIDRAAAELRRAQAELGNSELEYERLRSLLDSGVISQQLVDDAQTRRDMSKAGLAVADKNHQLALLGPREEQVEAARAELAQAQAAIDYWKTQLRETEIRAPSAGTILERISEVGEMVSTSFAGGAVVVALADLNDIQVELEISQSDFHHIDPDNGCLMSPLAYPDRKYKCEVFEIAPEANRQRATIQVKVQILEPDEYLRPEMDAQVNFYRPGVDFEDQLRPMTKIVESQAGIEASK